MAAGVPLLLSLIVGLSVLAFVAGVRAFVASDGVEARIQALLRDGAPPTLREIEMQASFYERAIRPIRDASLQGLGRLAPQQNIGELQHKLEMAGYLGKLSVIDFLGLKILFGLLLGGLISLVLILSSYDLPIIVSIILSLFSGLVGFGLPNYWLSAQVKRRQIKILKALPDALDMLNICVRAGLGFTGAMQRFCDNWNNDLSEEFGRVITEVSLGKSRIEALEGMSRRTGVDEVISFVMAVSIAEKLGASIAQVLHIQAQQMRIARSQRAEKLAREASIKMLFPLVFLIFPAMFAVILGPTIPLLLETF
jgi:tight adherence protein C